MATTWYKLKRTGGWPPGTRGRGGVSLRMGAKGEVITKFFVSSIRPPPPTQVLYLASKTKPGLQSYLIDIVAKK